MLVINRELILDGTTVNYSDSIFQFQVSKGYMIYEMMISAST